MLRPPVSEQLQSLGLKTLAVIWRSATDRRQTRHPFEGIHGLQDTGEGCPLSALIPLLAEMSSLNFDELFV
jgi:hypothetical protein